MKTRDYGEVLVLEDSGITKSSLVFFEEESGRVVGTIKPRPFGKNLGADGWEVDSLWYVKIGAFGETYHTKEKAKDAAKKILGVA